MFNNLKKRVNLLNLSKLATDSLIYGLGTTVNRFISLLLLPILTSYLTPNDYGVISQLTTMGLFLSSIISLGLGSSIGICYFAKSDDKSKQAVISNSLTILLFSVFISTILLWSFSDQIGNILFKSEAYKWHIAFSLVNLGFSILIIPLQQYLQFNQKSAIFAWQSLLVNLTTIFLSLLLVIYFNAGSLGMLMAAALSQILSFLSLLIVTKIRPQIRNLSIAILWEIVLSGIPMIPSFFLLFYLQNWVRFPLATEYGLDIAGLFSIGSNFGLAITVITNSITVAWLPYALVSKDEWWKHRQDLANNFLKFYIVGSVTSLAFFLLAQPIVTTFTHPAYYRAWEVIGIIAFSYFIYALYSMILPILYLTNKVKYVLVSQSLAAGVLFFSIPLFLKLELIGAGLSILLGAALVLIIQMLINKYFVREYTIPYDGKKIVIFFIIICIGILISFNISYKNTNHFLLIVSTIFTLTLCLAKRLYPPRRSEYDHE